MEKVKNPICINLPSLNQSMIVHESSKNYNVDTSVKECETIHLSLNQGFEESGVIDLVLLEESGTVKTSPHPKTTYATINTKSLQPNYEAESDKLFKLNLVYEEDEIEELIDTVDIVPDDLFIAEDDQAIIEQSTTFKPKQIITRVEQITNEQFLNMEDPEEDEHHSDDNNVQDARTINDCNIPESENVDKEYVDDDSSSEFPHDDPNIIVVTYLIRITLQNCQSQKHLLIKIDVNNKYLCPFCILTYSSEDEVSTHINDHINIHGNFVCHQCSAPYIKKVELDRHIKQMHIKPTKLKYYWCIVCQREMLTMKGFHKHIMHHPSHRKTTCTYCSKTFTRGTNLKQHMKLHTGEKPYICNICQRPFRFKSGLQAHMRIHTGMRPYACNKCGRSFTQIVGLARHLKSHVSEKPFRCQTCGKTFDRRSELKIHVEKHIGVRPYICAICHNDFSDLFALRNHIKKYHNKNTVCYICFKGDFENSSELKEHILAHTEKESLLDYSDVKFLGYKSSNLTDKTQEMESKWNTLFPPRSSLLETSNDEDYDEYRLFF